MHYSLEPLDRILDVVAYYYLYLKGACLDMSNILMLHVVYSII